MVSVPGTREHAVIRAEGIAKTYRRGQQQVHALRDVSFTVARGEFVAVVGPSGSGKTTLLNLLGCMDTPTSGKLWVDGHEVHELADSERTRFRRDRLGFVFQDFGLLPTLTVEENVALPLLFAGRRTDSSVGPMLTRVGIAHRRSHRPAELSGGEMQRVAIARALIQKPALLLADEPTGNLDSATGAAIISLFQELNAQGLTIVVVTHNAPLASAATRRIALLDGRVAMDSVSNASGS